MCLYLMPVHIEVDLHAAAQPLIERWSSDPPKRRAMVGSQIEPLEGAGQSMNGTIGFRFCGHSITGATLDMPTCMRPTPEGAPSYEHELGLPIWQRSLFSP